MTLSALQSDVLPATDGHGRGVHRQPGSADYNLRLSQRRAEAVRGVLAASALTASAVGRGEAAPVASNTTAHGRSLNRRVEIRFR